MVFTYIDNFCYLTYLLHRKKNSLKNTNTQTIDCLLFIGRVFVLTVFETNVEVVLSENKTFSKRECDLNCVFVVSN